MGDIPEQRPGFLPRPALLAQLKGVARRPLVHVLTGPWGAGKTQLAAMYARARVAARWRLVAWIDASSPGSLRTGLAAVAAALGLSDGRPGQGPQGPADAGQDVRWWLEADGEHCLLVFDDATDPDVLQPFVPVRGAAQVLITAAWEPMPDLGSSVPVDVFSAEEAVALLNGRTGLPDRAGAAAVAAELGYLPLAVDQAAATIAIQRLEYEAYLERLRAVQARDYLVKREEQPYPPTAVGAVLLSLEAVRAADRTGVDAGVLEVMAVLSAAGVRQELLHAAGEKGALAYGQRRTAAGRVDKALAELAERALVTFTVGGQSIIMHHLVAHVVRDGLIQQGHLAAVCRATASALEAYAEAIARPRDYPAVRDVPQQVTALLDNAAELVGEGDQELARILLWLRFLALYHLVELGDNMPQAIAIGESLTADLQRILGPEHPATLNAQSSLAAAYRAAGRTAEAIPLFEQTLVGQVRRMGHDHPDALASQNNLAATYKDAGRAAEAILLFRLTLAANERELGYHHPSTLNSRVSLAGAYRDVGRIAEAIPLFEQALAGRERLLGPDHPDTLRSRSNLAAAYREAGRAAEAIPLLEQTLAVCEQLLGVDDPRTQAARNNLSLANREAQADSGLCGARSQAVRDGDGDADREGEGDEDVVCEGEGEGDGEADLGGLGEGDLDGSSEGDGDGGTNAGDDLIGGRVTVPGRLIFRDAFAGGENDMMAGAVAEVLLDEGLGSGRTGRARAGWEPAKVSTVTPAAATTHTTTATVAMTAPDLAPILSDHASLIALKRRVNRTDSACHVIRRCAAASGVPDEHSRRICSRSSAGSGASGSRSENAARRSVPR